METLSIQLSNLSEVSLRCGSDDPESDSRAASHRLVCRFWSHDVSALSEARLTRRVERNRVLGRAFDKAVRRKPLAGAADHANVSTTLGLYAQSVNSSMVEAQEPM